MDLNSDIKGERYVIYTPVSQQKKQGGEKVNQFLSPKDPWLHECCPHDDLHFLELERLTNFF